MPHYRNGQKANVGDRVRGTGYNVKGEIVGVVVGVEEGQTACNLKIAHAMPTGIPGMAARLDVEYGQADAFDPA